MPEGGQVLHGDLVVFEYCEAKSTGAAPADCAGTIPSSLYQDTVTAYDLYFLKVQVSSMATWWC